MKENIKNKLQGSVISNEEIRDVLNISRVTVHRWCKKGILKPLKIGGRVYFKKKDIEKLFKH